MTYFSCLLVPVRTLPDIFLSFAGRQTLKTNIHIYTDDGGVLSRRRPTQVQPGRRSAGTKACRGSAFSHQEVSQSVSAHGKIRNLGAVGSLDGVPFCFFLMLCKHSFCFVFAFCFWFCFFEWFTEKNCSPEG